MRKNPYQSTANAEMPENNCGVIRNFLLTAGERNLYLRGRGEYCRALTSQDSTRGGPEARPVVERVANLSGFYELASYYLS